MKTRLPEKKKKKKKWKKHSNHSAFDKVTLALRNLKSNTEFFKIT